MDLLIGPEFLEAGYLLWKERPYVFPCTRDKCQGARAN